MDFECPNCHSQQAKRLALTWASGLSKTKTKSVGAGAALFFNHMPWSLVAMVFKWVVIPFTLAFSFPAVFVHAGYSWGTSQSVLSAATRPPWRFRVLRSLVQAVFFTLIVGWVFEVFGFWASAHALVSLFHINPQHASHAEQQRILYAAIGIPASVIASIVIAAFVLGIRYNLKVWPKREAVWQRTFSCQRCGTLYVVPEFTPAGENVVRSDRAEKGGLLPRSPERKSEAEALADADNAVLRKRVRG
ncbi:hypothetical protein BI364_10160 [Acidihalobacter yilgarnensis]|uniref:Uncharacterized protein n=1 Tax=Acidihalobacter yilgarnensis TaxID=2819280 RepID=A0A1D8IPE0_9GAMM|nr:hypothetical protein [Acidihalobacter yilgarnensis]AOU98275.1 hypothetical protein BI364_10160 [Acidihalobacter yilgarnensis]